MADLRELVEFLDDYLEVSRVPDYPGAWNGLQVACRSPIESVCVATDACQATIDEAARDGAQLLIVHHGLFWGDPLPITGRSYRRLKALLDADMALYSSHLPLDVHPEIGNNVLLARELGLDTEGTFGRWSDLEGLGVWAATDLSLRDFVARVGAACGTEPKLIPGGPEHVRRVGIATGSAGSLIEQAHEEGLDTFVTGEGNHHTYHEATEIGLNVVYAGHYATETAGVRALGGLLSDRYGLDFRFADHPTGM
ncbi:MAG: Nif3-like dinuclear metal center hexameric protein [Gemmatimonadetes bacterium]|nr:Nif3-like dinuclear metal center hexameric protein [Gemmatimonadota bacterium]MBT8478447.1 Nif3-like dinuclear metal center hexameric protein [Gemmatimonadota bacterium]NNK47750.1 Nif3-like dinuclear metal center hexameric protein [Gemmatimonadota bacterium]